MSLEPLQSRIIQNTRPNNGTNNQPAQQSNQAKPDLQSMHVVPGTPSEPPKDPKVTKKNTDKVTYIKLKDISNEHKEAAMAILPKQLRKLDKNFTKSYRDIHPNPVLNIVLNYIYHCGFYLDTFYRLREEDLDNIYKLDPKFQFQGRYGLENLRLGAPVLRLKLNADLKKYDFSNADLRYADAKRVDLGGANLEGVNLSCAAVSALFNCANLKDANMEKGNFAFSNFNSVDIESANLFYANLVACHFHEANAKNANFEQAIIHLASFAKADLEGANFKDAFTHQLNRDQRFVYFTDANLDNANFSGARLYNANFENASMQNAILSLSSFNPKEQVVNLLALKDADLTNAQIFLGYSAKKIISNANNRDNDLPKTTMYMSDTNLQGSTIVNLVMFPDPGSLYYRADGNIVHQSTVDVQNAYLRNVSFLNQNAARSHLNIKGCRYTPDVEWPENFQQDTVATPIEITDWSKTNLQYHKFDKYFMIQSTMGKTEEEADKIKSIDLSGADCSNADFIDFHPHMHKCKWQSTNIENAKGVHKLMIVGGAIGNPQRPIFGFKNDAEMEEVLRRAKFGAYGDVEE